METLTHVVARPEGKRERVLKRLRDWVRRHYGLRELIFPEKYRVDTRHDVVVTYSSCLALVYFADDAAQLSLEDLRADPRRQVLYDALLEHEGIGLVLTRNEHGVHAESRAGRALLVDGTATVLAGTNPVAPYGTAPYVLRSIEELVRQPNSGDVVIFGAYDGYDIVSFDDQVGAHGSAGGDQVYPFIITPAALNMASETLENARDINRAVLSRYAAQAPATAAAPPAGVA
jgi:hypothetical protein